MGLPTPVVQGVPSVLDIAPLATRDLPGLAALFGTDRGAQGCWCMWFVVRVKLFHEGAGGANAEQFRSMAEAAREPMGLLARRDGQPVGWVSAGPRARYARAIATPTYAGRDPGEDGAVWLVPCFFVQAQERRSGLARSLLEAAVVLAQASGARAVEGFPTVAAGGADRQVGTERLFADCGFQPIRRPSSNRVMMRRDLVAA